MTARTANEVYYDPWEVDLNSDPYPMFRLTRDNAPLYYNDQHGFCALSRFDGVTGHWSTIRHSVPHVVSCWRSSRRASGRDRRITPRFRQSTWW